MKTNTITAVPKLRFPEFQEEEGWERSEFNKVYDLKITNSLSRAKLNYVKGSVKNIHYGDIHTQFSALFDINKEEVPFINEEETNYKSETADFCIEGDIVIADASEDIKDIGKSIEIINIANQKIVCGLHTIHARPKKNKLYIGFGAYLFQSHFIRTQIQLESQGAKVLGLSKGRLDKINLLLPKTDEQRKIADCLSSLDTLIKSENEQLDTLKEYKAGLLQQLFPVEGETTPKLRFAEFKDDGDWELMELESCLDYLQPTKYIVQSTDYNDKYSTPVLTAGKTFILGYTDEKTGVFSEQIPVIIFDDFTTASKFVDFPFKVKSSAMKILLAKDSFDIKFLYESIQNLDYETGVHKRHWISVFSKIRVAVPKLKEQQKIADCLSSLDNLIQAKDNQIDTLKTHKQGLMQQLFPMMDGE